MPEPSKTILAIESAIAGGSLALSNEGKVITFSGDEGLVTRAELLLPQIDKLLQSADVPLDALHMIAVSAGPGSFTGIRIGIATALGLRAALQTPVKRVPILAAMVREQSGTVTACVPVGRGMLASQVFEVDEDSITPHGPPELSAQLADTRVAGKRVNKLVITSGIEAPNLTRTETIVCENLAEALLAAAVDPRIEDAEPIFISKASHGL